MKYVSDDNLKYYDSKLKDYINSDELNKFAKFAKSYLQSYHNML